MWHPRPCSRAIASARAASSVGVSTFAGSFARSRAKFAASATIAPRSAARRSAGDFRARRARRSCSDLTSDASSSLFLWRSKRYSPSTAPSAIACAHASGSRPAMPAPCVIVAKSLDATAAQVARDGRAEVAHAVDREFGALAQPGDEHARRRELAERVDERQLAPLAADVARGDELADHAGERAVDGARGAAGRGDAFEQVDDDALRLGSGDVAGFDLDLHAGSPLTRSRTCYPHHMEARDTGQWAAAMRTIPMFDRRGRLPLRPPYHCVYSRVSIVAMRRHGATQAATWPRWACMTP